MRMRLPCALTFIQGLFIYEPGNSRKVRRSSTNDNPPNRLAAFQTRFALPIVNPMQLLKRPFQSIRIDIIAQRAAAMSQRAFEDNLDRGGELGGLLAA